MNRNLHLNNSNVHMKGFALGLALKQRRNATRRLFPCGLLSWILNHSCFPVRGEAQFGKWLKFGANSSEFRLRACVYIYIRQLGSFRGRQHGGLSIWLLLLAVFNTLFWVYAFLSFLSFFPPFFHEKWKKLEVRHFRMAWKWPSTVTRRAKH